MHSLGVATSDDADAQTHFLGELNGITILDIHRAQGFAIGRKRDGRCRQHAVYIKNNGANAL